MEETFAPFDGVISNCSRVNVRSAPNPRGDVVTSISAGTRVSVKYFYPDAGEGAYYKIQVKLGKKTYKGWVKTEYVEHLDE